MGITEHGAEPPRFKVQAPAFAGEDRNNSDARAPPGSQCKGGDLPFKARGFSPVVLLLSAAKRYFAVPAPNSRAIHGMALRKHMQPDTSSTRVAGMIASVTSSTIYLSTVWNDLSLQEKRKLIVYWAVLISEGPGLAAERIIQDMSARPEWQEAHGKYQAKDFSAYRLVLNQIILNYGPEGEMDLIDPSLMHAH